MLVVLVVVIGSNDHGQDGYQQEGDESHNLIIINLDPAFQLLKPQFGGYRTESCRHSSAYFTGYDKW